MHGIVPRFYHDNNVVYEYPFHCATSFAKTTWAIPYLGKNYGICCYANNASCLLATVQIGCTPEWNSVLKLGPQTHQLGAMYHVLPGVIIIMIPLEVHQQCLHSPSSCMVNLFSGCLMQLVSTNSSIKVNHLKKPLSLHLFATTMTQQSCACPRHLSQVLVTYHLTILVNYNSCTCTHLKSEVISIITMATERHRGTAHLHGD